MREVTPQFLTVFMVAWFTALIYVSAFILMARRRQVLAGAAGGSLLSAIFDRNRPIFTIDDLRFLFSGEHQALGDSILSRRVLVARTLFFTTAAVFVVVLVILFSGGAADVG
jgi:hypothetical protein